MLAIIVAGAVAASAHLTPVPLWHGLRAVMTPTEVARAVPSAVHVDGRRNSLLADDRVRATLSTSAWSLEGIPVKTRFYFADNRLAAIGVSFPKQTDRAWPKSVISALTEDLTRSYGRPDNLTASPAGPACEMVTGRWVRTPTTAVLSSMYCASRFGPIATAAVTFIPTTLFRRYTEENHGTPLPQGAYRPK